MWKVNIISFFPEIFPGPLLYSVTGRALISGACSIKAFNIKDYAQDRQLTVDEPPYGGGGGMILKPDVIGRAVDELFVPNGGPIIHFSPKGEKFDQKMSQELVKYDEINFICSRFEGMDERVINAYNVRELSIGDYVISSGDMAALVVLDACIRVLDDVLDREKALEEESFGLDSRYNNLLEYPHYTKPRIWRGLEVPEILLSGNHKLIDEWRLREAEKKTKETRSDLWLKYKTTQKKDVDR